MTYEQECRDFEEWFRKEDKRIENIPPSGVLDGEQRAANAIFIREADRKIKDIEKKYNRKYLKTIGEILNQ